MRPLVLCFERLQRIRHLLKHCGGAATMRDLWRSHEVFDWEVQQAAELGWVTITTRKPRVGRPSRVVEFCGGQNAKFPERRCWIEREISIRHWWFALRSVGQSVKYGMRRWGFPGVVSAYINTYHPRSRNGAYASTSRLLRHPDVRAARQWFYAKSGRELPFGEKMPSTASGIRKRLRELGNRRASQC
jgi:hypothetical protein